MLINISGFFCRVSVHLNIDKSRYIAIRGHNSKEHVREAGSI
jgi:hypothetical protein